MGALAAIAALSLQVAHPCSPDWGLHAPGNGPHWLGHVFCPGDVGTTAHCCSLVPRLPAGASGLKPTALGSVCSASDLPRPSSPLLLCRDHSAPGDIWQCLETFLFPRLGWCCWHLVSRGQAAAEHPLGIRQPSVPRDLWAKASVVLSLRNPGPRPGGGAEVRAQKTALAHGRWAVSIGHNDRYRARHSSKVRASSRFCAPRLSTG